MANRGRFGKYGDVKRMARLRSARSSPSFYARLKHPSSKESFRAAQGPNKLNRIECRPGTLADVVFVKDLSESAFNEYGDYGGVIARWLESGFAKTLIAMDGRKPCGFAMIGRTHPWVDLEETFELLAIAVKQSKRRQGVGHRLVGEAIGLARSSGAAWLILHTAPDNHPAMRLFQAQGFETKGLKKNFYPRGQDAIIMVRQIL